MKNPTASNLAALIAADISALSNGELLDHIAELIDGASDAGSADATTRALELLNLLGRGASSLTPVQEVVAHYFRANAWANRQHEAVRSQSWDWELEEARHQILELRRAKRHAAFNDLDPTRRCQILTNLGNQLGAAGRTIEAIAYWDEALAIGPRFAMARGNRAIGLHTYAQHVYDPGHAAILAAAAHDELERVLSGDMLHEADNSAAVRWYEQHRDQLARNLDLQAIRNSVQWDAHSLGRAEDERRYRTWCLNNRLFLNPLNDLRAGSLAAHDVMTLPSITASVSSPSPPPIIGFFNQMKQEYVSARFFLYEGLHTRESHYADRDVLLYNTLDYAVLGLGSERVRAAFRVAYSIFDKIAFFLNDYLAIGWPEKQVSLRGLWYEANGKGPKPLRQRFAAHPNLPLRGLFWLTKEFVDQDFKDATEPDAEAIADIRNHLEHKYLQLRMLDSPPMGTPHATLGFPVLEVDFQLKALRVLKYVRAALMYLSMAVETEEQARRPQTGLTAQMPLWPLRKGRP